MTYDALASGVESNQPVEIFRFTQGGESWEFTSWEEQQDIAGLKYLPEAIQRSEIRQSSETSDGVVTVTVPATNAFASRFAPSTPGKIANIVIQRYQKNDGATPQVITIFDGRVGAVDFVNDELIAEITCQPRKAAESRPIPRFTYQNLCNNVLYDDACKVSPTDPRFLLTATVAAVNERTITITGAGAFGASWFVAGWVELADSSDSRLILGQSTDDLDLLLPFPSSIVGKSVRVLAGCDHTIGVCESKFDTPEDPTSNVINYGGFAFVPTRNPYQVGLD